MTHIEKIATKLKINPKQVAATVALLDADNTVPFIARYRKEVTGGLDEEQIRQIEENLKRIRQLDERRQTVLKTIKDQDALTPELNTQIQKVETRTELEDLYRPYKPKRKTRASAAKEKGLQSLADMILSQVLVDESARELAATFINEEVPNDAAALAGARDIVAEAISDNPDIRKETRAKALKWGNQQTQKLPKADDERGTYETYYDFDTHVDRLRPHQILAINRAEREKVLRVDVSLPERDWQSAIGNQFKLNHKSPLKAQMELAIEDAAQRLLLPAIERDVRRGLTEIAEEHAIDVFATNLRNLLNQPPLSGHTVMGIDPGFRTGCKVAVIDITGKSLGTATIYPHEPQRQSQKAKQILSALIEQHKVTLIAIGNGTASRETEQLVAELIQELLGTLHATPLHYLIVNEAGASVYSASKLARGELPDMDVSMRGAVSIARRVQDPLAELVKIDPKSIGVGMYQHDVDQKALAEALTIVVESVVNQVGVDANTASPALLQHVAGIGPTLATRMVEFRDQNGPFPDRESLKKVKGMGPKAFEQAAGFLRIRDGENPLDSSAIHPESYPIAEAVLRRADLGVSARLDERESALSEILSDLSLGALATELGTGVPTLEDIIEQLIRPGRDPREDLLKPILRSDVLKMEDLAIGMRLKGTVRNVVDFGAFIDIGVKQDGLLHRSQIPRGEKPGVGDVIDVIIRKVEAGRGRISLGWAK
ncbi:MAG: RNA-binding transcriptional accessory protein [Chloroflexi bacterium]|nr:RNA-binding transcriptional accessory protein [Chloroflexota bacterium]